MLRVAISGASGFIGQALWRTLVSPPFSGTYTVSALCRSSVSIDESLDGTRHMCGDLGQCPDVRSALTGTDIVVHTAARVHVLSKERKAAHIKMYQQTNVDGTVSLARQAAACGVSRFIFLSSIKVNGETTPIGAPFRVTDTPKPQDPYGQSKWDAEQKLWAVGEDTGMDVICLRLPLVYGPGVKGNFLSLLRWVDRGWPLPLGRVHNQRSLIGLDNLIDLIRLCFSHPQAGNKTFLVSDDDDISTPGLIQSISRSMGKPIRLWPVTPSVLRTGFYIMGRGGLAQRLVDNLQIESSHIKSTLGWAPPISLNEGIRRTVHHWSTGPEYNV